MLVAFDDCGGAMSGFGRKGIGAGTALPATGGGLDALRNSPRGTLTQPAPALAKSDAMSRSVEAFRAAERANRLQHEAASRTQSGPQRPERSLMIAYLLWFFLGAISVHRFYLRAYQSGAIQLGLFVTWMALSYGGMGGAFASPGPLIVAAVIATGWMVWLLADAYLIYRIHRRNCVRPGEVAEAFA